MHKIEKYKKMLKNGSLHYKYLCFLQKTLKGSCISTFIFLQILCFLNSFDLKSILPYFNSWYDTGYYL